MQGAQILPLAGELRSHVLQLRPGADKAQSPKESRSNPGRHWKRQSPGFKNIFINPSKKMVIISGDMISWIQSQILQTSLLKITDMYL